MGQDGILRGGWQPPLSLHSANLSKSRLPRTAAAYFGVTRTMLGFGGAFIPWPRKKLVHGGWL